MGKIILLLFLVYSLHGLAQAKKVKVLVESQDSNVLNLVKSEFVNQISLLANINVSDDSPDYVVHVTVAEILDGGATKGIAMSSILVKKQSLEGQDIFQLMNSVLNIIEYDPGKVKQKCAEIVARFDLNYFKK